MLCFERMLTAVDSHTEGMPTRVVTGGLGPVAGGTMLEKQRYIAGSCDHLRRLLVLEPRGHDAMVAALLLPPSDPDADLGVVFVDEMGYLPMCGHGTIGVATVAVATGIVRATEPCTRLVLDTPAGRVTAEVAVRDGRVSGVRLTNVPAFLLERDVQVEVAGLGRVVLDVAYGGNLFAILPARSVGLALEPGRSRAIVDAGARIMEAVERQVSVQHPLHPEIHEVKHVIFTGPANRPDAHAKNATVIYPGVLDRSPCGTGTSARMAQLFERGELGLNEPFVHESILGTTFTGRLVAQEELGAGLCAVVPAIEGRAWIDGFQQLVLDPDDPFPAGFALG